MRVEEKPLPPKIAPLYWPALPIGTPFRFADYPGNPICMTMGSTIEGTTHYVVLYSGRGPYSDENRKMVVVKVEGAFREE